jgi:hypothetical protein
VKCLLEGCDAEFRTVDDFLQHLRDKCPKVKLQCELCEIERCRADSYQHDCREEFKLLVKRLRTEAECIKRDTDVRNLIQTSEIRTLRAKNEKLNLKNYEFADNLQNCCKKRRCCNKDFRDSHSRRKIERRRRNLHSYRNSAEVE